MRLNVFENLTLKLIALVLAIIIWFFVVGEQKSEVRLTVPLELRNLPTHLEITQQSLTQVEVAVRGFSSVVKRLTPGDIDVHIDLSTVIRGVNTFVLSPDDISVPIGVSVIQVSPSNVNIVLDATFSKTVPVQPVVRGIPAQGYTIGAVTVEPKTVTLSGAHSIVRTIEKAETEIVSVDEATKDIVKKAKVKIQNGSVRIEKEEEKVVSVNVKIIPEMTDRFFEDIPLQVEGEKRQFTLSPKTITALIYGPKLKLLNMKPVDIPVFINTTSLPAGQSVVQANFKLPESMSVKTYYPKTITINIVSND